MSAGSNDLMKVIVLVSLAFLLTFNGKEVRVFMLLQIGSRSIVLAFQSPLCRFQVLYKQEIDMRDMVEV